jgi:hypothetical protein
MERTIVQFIIENIFLFLPLGIAGVVITAILMFLPKKNIPQHEESVSDIITLFTLRFNLYNLVYFFVWIMILIIGLLSNYIVPTLIGSVIAAVPLILLQLIKLKSSKES